ncbi:MAG: hypothetical protein JWM51_1266 [Microbacteriaceae bacterium]|jgi:uncharacterized membrane protein|nr:hypothetical protein [Microbacteriaceae bacterium]
MNVGILLVRASALAYGSADFIGGVGSRRYSSWQVVLVGQSAGALVMLVAGLTLPGSPVTLDFAWALLAGVGSATGSIFLFRGFARGRIVLTIVAASGATGLGIAGVLDSLYPAVTVLLAAGLLGERVTVGQRTGIGICTVAAAAMALG